MGYSALDRTRYQQERRWDFSTPSASGETPTAPSPSVPRRPDPGDPGRFQVVPAAYVFLRRTGTVGGRAGAGAAGDQGDVLLLLREGTGYLDGHWAGVAGHVEADESCIDAAVREAREEVGVEIRAEDLEPVCAMHRTHGNHEWIDERADFFFQTWTWSGEPTLREPAKAAALRWWPLQGLPRPTVPHEALVLGRLLGGRVPAILTFGFDGA